MDRATRAARLAYEKGRLLSAVRRAAVVLPAGLAAYACGTPAPNAAAMAGILFVLMAIGGWWRTDLARGGLAGAAIIFIPMVLGVFMRAGSGILSEAQCAHFCLYGAGILGGGAGYWLGNAAGLRSREDGAWFTVAALMSASLSMTVGCTALGFGSLSGLALGLLAVGVPSFVYARGTVLA